MSAVATWAAMRRVLGGLRVGDSVVVELARPAGPLRTTVRVTGFDTPTVRIEMLPDATARQRALRERWMAGR